MVLFHAEAQLLEPRDHTLAESMDGQTTVLCWSLPVFLAVDWEIWEPWNQTDLSSNPDTAALISFDGALGGCLQLSGHPEAISKLTASCPSAWEDVCPKSAPGPRQGRPEVLGSNPHIALGHSPILGGLFSSLNGKCKTKPRSLK